MFYISSQIIKSFNYHFVKILKGNHSSSIVLVYFLQTSELWYCATLTEIQHATHKLYENNT